MTVAVFVVILMVVAGLVAAGGDRMGHRAARAKIRIGKLRPRTASTIIAVITGILISLVTFGVVFAVSKDFRDALLRFDAIKGDLARLEGQFADAQARLNEAVQAKDRAEGELSGLRQSKIEVVKNLSQAQMELSTAQGDLAKVRTQVKTLTGQVKDLNTQIANKKREAEIFAAVVRSRQSELTQAQAEVKSYQKGAIVLARGTPLAYQRIKPGDVPNLAQVLQPALDRAAIRLGQNGLGAADNTGDVARKFIDTYAYKNASQDYVVIITTASNVVQGEPADLSFEVQPLNVLVHKGDTVLTVKVEEDKARITCLGQATRDVDIPEQFTTDALVNFSVAIQECFVDGAGRAGFLPDFKTGEIPGPVIKLSGKADELINTKRPFTILFTATEDADSLKGLASADVTISPNV